MKARHSLRSFLAISAAALPVMMASIAHAADYYWNTTTTDTWATGANWSDDPASGGTTGTVPTSTDSAFFNQSSVTGATTVLFDDDAGIAGLTFANTGTTTLTSDSATPRLLTIGSGGITINSGAGAVTLGNATNVVNLSLGAAESWTHNAASQFTVVNAVDNGGNLLTLSGNGNTTITGVLGGAGGLTKNGTGRLILSSINNLSGLTTINAGIVDVRGSIANGSPVWGTGDITISQGANLFLNPSAQARQNTVGHSVSGTITVSGWSGTSSIRFGGNDNKFVISGDVTGQPGVAQTLALIQGSNLANNGDRQNIIVSGPIADGSGGTLGVSVDFSNASSQGQRGFVNLTGQNTFTGDLTITNSRGLNGGGTHPGAWVTIGGQRYDSFNVGTGVIPGTGHLGTSADYSGNISISTGSGGLTTLSFLTSANQILRGVISGTGSLHTQGTGTLTLTNANTFSGNTTIVSGSGGIIMENALALQNSPLVTTSGDGSLTLFGTPTSLQLGGLSGTSGSLGTIIAGGAFSNISALTLNPQAGVAVTYGGGLADGAAGMTLTKAGAGTQILSGNNTYTGATTVNRGTLLLDMTGAGALTPSSALTLGGGNFQVRGKTSGDTTQTLADLALAANSYSTITLDPNGGTSTTLTLGDAWTRSVGSSLLIDYSSLNAGTREVVTANATTGIVLSNGIYGSVLVRDSAGVTGFATRAAGSDQPITRFDDTTGTTLADDSDEAATNFTTLDTVYTSGTLDWSNDITDRSVNSLAIDTTISGGTIHMGASTNILTLTSGGILFRGSNNVTLTGGRVGADDSEVIVHQTGTGTLTIASLLPSGTGSLTKNGSGMLIVTNAGNAYSGSTTLNAGTLRYASRFAFGTSTLYLAGGTRMQKISEQGNTAAWAMANNIVLTGGQVEMNVDWTGIQDQWFTGMISGPGSLRITGGGSNITRGVGLSGNNNFSGGVTLDSNRSAARLGHHNGLGTGAVTVAGVTDNRDEGLGAFATLSAPVPNNIVINAGRILNIGGGGSNMTLSGVISGPGNVNMQVGGRTYTLSGANTYTGTTRVAAGTLALGASNVLPDTTNVTLGGATLNASTFTDTAGTLAVTGTATISLGSGGALAFANSSAATWTGSLNITGTFVPGASIRFGTTSAGLTPAQLATITVNGTGAGTYSLDSNGFLVEQAAGSPFATWSGGADFDADANNDGVKNGLAWVLGAADVNANALDLLPTLDNSDPTHLIFNFRRKDEANTDPQTTIATQYGTDLTNWTNAVDNGTDIIITESNDFYGSGVDKVEVKISRSLAVDGKLFIRLSAEQ